MESNFATQIANNSDSEKLLYDLSKQILDIPPTWWGFGSNEKKTYFFNLLSPKK
jgi:hypothetical protein